MGREHWVETTLGECCQINPRNKVNDESLEVTFVTMSDISQNSPLFKSTQVRSFSEVKKGFTHFAENDVLFAKITPCMENGKAALANNLRNGLGCGTTELHVIRPLCGVESTFVYNFIHQPIFRTEAEQRFTGSAGQRRVPVDFLYEYPFPLPPLNEQKRIVEKLDAILPKVKNAKARLEKILLILKKFRQSVRSAACSGRLTEDWREGKDLPDWEDTSIRSIAVSMSTGPFGSMLHSYDYIENGIPVINPTHIGSDLIMPDNSITLSQEKADELSRYKLKRNDILLARRGDLSKCGIVGEKEVNWIAGTGLFILRTHVNPFFFKYVFGTDDVQNILNNNSIGSTMLNLNQTILGNIEILLPPLEEQQEIVRRVEKLFTLADSLEAKYKKAIQRVEKIEQSVLVKAFKGELANPDTNDEPATELLKRILEEKTMLETTKKPRSKRSPTS